MAMGRTNPSSKSAMNRVTAGKTAVIDDAERYPNSVTFGPLQCQSESARSYIYLEDFIIGFTYVAVLRSLEQRYFFECYVNGTPFRFAHVDAALKVATIYLLDDGIVKF